MFMSQNFVYSDYGTPNVTSCNGAGCMANATAAWCDAGAATRSSTTTMTATVMVTLGTATVVTTGRSTLTTRGTTSGAMTTPASTSTTTTTTSSTMTSTTSTTTAATKVLNNATENVPGGPLCNLVGSCYGNDRCGIAGATHCEDMHYGKKCEQTCRLLAGCLNQSLI